MCVFVMVFVRTFGVRIHVPVLCFICSVRATPFFVRSMPPRGSQPSHNATAFSCARWRSPTSPTELGSVGFTTGTAWSAAA